MSASPLPESLKNYPYLGQWLALGQPGQIRVFSGKVELGQGITHALRLIAAEELELSVKSIEMVRTSTTWSPNEAITSGSMSVQQSGTAIRMACAHLHAACRERAAHRAGVSVDQVVHASDHFEAAGLRLSYADLVDAALLSEAVDPQRLAPRHGRASRLGAVRSSDVADKVFGRFRYLQDMQLPDMLFGQIHRPATLQAAQMDLARWALLQVQLEALEDVVKVVRDGLLVGVLATSHRALQRVGQLMLADVTASSPPLWHGQIEAPLPDQLPQWLQSQAVETTTVFERQSDKPAPASARIWRAQYGRAYLQHASIGLCCAIAQWTGPRLHVWSHSQGVFHLQRDLAMAMAMAPDLVSVEHVEGAGCYGHNGADDVAFDAAWLAQHAPGRPVRLEWTREQEMACAPLGPAMDVAVEAGVDASGQLMSWKQTVWSQGHGTRPGRGQTPALLGAWQVQTPSPVTMAINMPSPTGGGADRNATPPYDIGHVEIISHRILAMPLRVSALRSLGAHVNVLAAESLMDEIARGLGRDPLEYRLAHLTDARARAVLQEVTRLADWHQPRHAQTPEGFGRGLAYARYKGSGAYCAVVVDLVVEDKVKLKKIYIAADLGLVVHADGVSKQLEGGAIQAASWTLCEAADIGPQGVRSNSWDSYPILGFSDTPEVVVSLIDRPDHDSLGAGECSAGPTAAAIANAIDNALGLRMRRMPFTAQALVQAAHANPV